MKIGDLVKFEGANLSKGRGRMIGIVVPWKSVDAKVQWPPEHEMVNVLWADGDIVAFKKKRLEVAK
jgi:hypothetical protein